MNFYFIRAVSIFCVNILYEDKKKNKNENQMLHFLYFLDGLQRIVNCPSSGWRWNR